jgi:D-arabinose 1-dehydrogenase-like Zn-dependent alcohol dehydrogenase
VTTYNGLRQSGALGGDRVAILGIGGLGHLGVQFAVRLGFETAAIASELVTVDRMTEAPPRSARAWPGSPTVLSM